MSELRGPLSGARRVVIKVGTTVVSGPDGRLALGRLGSLVEAIGRCRAAGREVVLVSSGAIGLGAERLGFPQRPSSVEDRQACAAAGQGLLMGLYDGLFRHQGLVSAQVLLTAADFDDRARYVHLAGTLQRLLDLGVVPIVNENDTVSTAELALRGPRVFGDNDRLSALVASGLAADALLLLSDVDAVYTAPPGTEGAEPVRTYGAEVSVTLGGLSAGGRGGMGAKIAAAQVGQRAGVHVVIASGHQGQTVDRVLAGEAVGTWFPAASRPPSKRRWLAFATTPTGRLHLDAGAVRAVAERQASLLAKGVASAEGRFAEGDVVSLVGPDGAEVGRGRAMLGAEALAPQVGNAAAAHGTVVVHRDHIVIFDQELP